MKWFGTLNGCIQNLTKENNNFINVVEQCLYTIHLYSKLMSNYSTRAYIHIGAVVLGALGIILPINSVLGFGMNIFDTFTGLGVTVYFASVALIGQKDSSVASKATLDIETEEVVAVVGTFTASHKIAVWINGVEYNIELDAV